MFFRRETNSVSRMLLGKYHLTPLLLIILCPCFAGRWYDDLMSDDIPDEVDLKDPSLFRAQCSDEPPCNTVTCNITFDLQKKPCPRVCLCPRDDKVPQNTPVMNVVANKCPVRPHCGPKCKVMTDANGCEAICQCDLGCDAPPKCDLKHCVYEFDSNNCATNCACEKKCSEAACPGYCTLIENPKQCDFCYCPKSAKEACQRFKCPQGTFCFASKDDCANGTCIPYCINYDDSPELACWNIECPKSYRCATQCPEGIMSCHSGCRKSKDELLDLCQLKCDEGCVRIPMDESCSACLCGGRQLPPWYQSVFKVIKQDHALIRSTNIQSEAELKEWFLLLLVFMNSYEIQLQTEAQLKELVTEFVNFMKMYKLSADASEKDLANWFSLFVTVLQTKQDAESDEDRQLGKWFDAFKNYVVKPVVNPEDYTEGLVMKWWNLFKSYVNVRNILFETTDDFQRYSQEFKHCMGNFFRNPLNTTKLLGSIYIMKSNVTLTLQKVNDTGAKFEIVDEPAPVDANKGFRTPTEIKEDVEEKPTEPPTEEETEKTEKTEKTEQKISRVFKQTFRQQPIDKSTMNHF